MSTTTIGEYENLTKGMFGVCLVAYGEDLWRCEEGEVMMMVIDISNSGCYYII